MKPKQKPYIAEHNFSAENPYPNVNRAAMFSNKRYPLNSLCHICSLKCPDKKDCMATALTCEVWAVTAGAQKKLLGTFCTFHSNYERNKQNDKMLLTIKLKLTETLIQHNYFFIKHVCFGETL